MHQLARSMLTSLTSFPKVTEDQLWSYTIQLATALRAIHGAGLICRGGALDASKVLITSRGRIRLCAVGFLDVLHGDPGEDKQFLQRIDLAEMGRLLLSLACGSAMNASLEVRSGGDWL